MKNLLSILKMDFVEINQIGKNLRFFSCLLSCLILVFGSSFQSLADISTSSNAFAVNPDFLISTGSNADPYGLMTMELTDDDYGISTYSSISSVNNTIDYHYAKFWIQQIDVNTEVRETFSFSLSSDGFARYSVPEGKAVLAAGLRLLPGALPRSGNYRFELSFSSDLSQSYSTFRFWSVRSIANASPLEDYTVATSYTQQLSGDIYCDAVVCINSLDHFTYFWNYSNSVPAGSLIAGYFDVNFTSSSDQPDYSTVGSGMGQQDYESDVSGSLSDLSSSVGELSEDMSSAAESLEYISTSQNLIIQGIDNVIMHISDQLYAFWDQLYNLIHEPTYAKLEEILAALRAIANNSDIYAVVEQVKESSEKQTADIMANDNANTAKVEAAVEKHGNFIIEGLKSLFIPSDEYFKSYFDDLYQYFSDRFGFLSFPIDLLIRLIDLFVNSANSDCILTLPEFEISGEQLITEASFNLTDFLENDFALLLSSIRMVTSIGLIMAFVHLCQDKWNEVMRN